MAESNSNTVLHIAPTPFFSDRGCHIRIEGIVNCLEQLGYSNIVCTYHHGRNVKNINTKRIKTIKQYTKTEAGPSAYKLWADWRLLWLCVKEFRANQPIVIHAHLHEGVLIGTALRTLFFWKKIILIGDLQGSLTGELDAHGMFKKLPFLAWPFKAIEWILMRCATKLVCSSSHALEKIEAEFGLKQNSISLVQDGATVPQAIDQKQQSELIKKYSLPKNSTLAVYSGALLEAKGLNELQQLIELTQDTPELHFLIIGYPTENLEQFLAENDLQSRCSLTGRVPFEQLPQLLQLADVAIDPKNSDAGEGSGKILNYIAAGLPVLAFNHTNNREFLPANTELADDTGQMAKQLIELCQNKSQRQQISQRNFKHFQQHYSWDKATSQLDTVYKSTINS